MCPPPSISPCNCNQRGFESFRQSTLKDQGNQYNYTYLGFPVPDARVMPLYNSHGDKCGGVDSGALGVGVGAVNGVGGGAVNGVGGGHPLE